MSENLVVSDTNIFIDLLSTDLLELFFNLPFDFSTTDFVVAEIVDNKERRKIEAFIKNKKLFVKKFNVTEFAEVIQKYQSNGKKLSIIDCSVWHYAKNSSSMLLTGDSSLRKIAENDSIKVAGILFVFDKLVEEKLISGKVMSEKLQNLMKINPRLPLSECNKRIEKWK